MTRRLDRFSQTLLRVFKRLFGSRLQQQAVVSRGAPCPCGSGRKYKRCCLPKEARKPAVRRPGAVAKPR